MINNYQLLIEYDGTKFVGWQTQKKGMSVQGEIEKILKKILKKKIRLNGSGRTDSGVHALEQSATFKSDIKIKNKVLFLRSMNHFLSKKNISILNFKTKKINFHARFSARKRSYKYIIINRESPLSLMKKKAWHLKKKLNIDLMKQGLLILKKNKDFSTFRSSSCSAKSPIRTLDKAFVRKKNLKIEIFFSSKSFLQQQVRSMVGCLKYLSEGKWSLKDFEKVVKSKQRSKCAPPAPPHGLYLKKVYY